MPSHTAADKRGPSCRASSPHTTPASPYPHPLPRSPECPTHRSHTHPPSASSPCSTWVPGSCRQREETKPQPLSSMGRPGNLHSAVGRWLSGPCGVWEPGTVVGLGESQRITYKFQPSTTYHWKVTEGIPPKDLKRTSQSSLQGASPFSPSRLTLYLLPRPPGLRKREPRCLRRGSSEVGAAESSLSVWDLLEHGFLAKQLRLSAKADGCSLWVRWV